MDYQGTLNLLAAAKQASVEHVVLISSIGADDILYPLNLLFGILFWKKRAEEAIQRSGLRYTIVRPGGTVFAHQSAVPFGHCMAWTDAVRCAASWRAGCSCHRLRRKQLSCSAPMCCAGGLTNETRDGQPPGSIVMAGPNHFGLPPRARAGSILRSQACSHMARVYQICGASRLGGHAVLPALAAGLRVRGSLHVL